MKNSHVGQWFGSGLQCRRVLDRGGFDDNTIRCALAAHGEYGAYMCWPVSWAGSWPGSWPGSWAGWVCGCPSTPFRTQPPPSIHLPQSWPTRLGPTTRVRRCNRIHAMHQHRSERLLLRNRALVGLTSGSRKTCICCPDRNQGRSQGARKPDRDWRRRHPLT